MLWRASCTSSGQIQDGNGTFKEDLNELTEVEWRTETGSWFQITMVKKERWPLDFVRKDVILNTCSWVSEEEQSCQEGYCVVMSGEHFPRKLMMQNQYVYIYLSHSNLDKLILITAFTFSNQTGCTVIFMPSSLSSDMETVKIGCKYIHTYTKCQLNPFEMHYVCVFLLVLCFKEMLAMKICGLTSFCVYISKHLKILV